MLQQVKVAMSQLFSESHSANTTTEDEKLAQLSALVQKSHSFIQQILENQKDFKTIRSLIMTMDQKTEEGLQTIGAQLVSVAQQGDETVSKTISNLVAALKEQKDQATVDARLILQHVSDEHVSWRRQQSLESLRYQVM